MKIKCILCKNSFIGLEGKEDTCPKCLKKIIKRDTAIAIIEQVIEPLHYPKRGVDGEKYYQLEDTIIKIINKHI